MNQKEERRERGGVLRTMKNGRTVRIMRAVRKERTEREIINHKSSIINHQS